MGKSKKGSAFERDTCKKLSLWFSHGERDDIFWRTAGSGARATCRAKQGLMTADSAGDICAIHPSGKPFTRVSIWELKRGYSAKNSNRGISLLTIVDKLSAEKPPILVEWWEKLKDELQTHNRKFGFIIFKRDRKNACIAMHTSTFAYLNKRNAKKYFFPPFGPTATVYTGGLELLVMQLEDFLNWCEPETLTRKIVRRQKGAAYEQDQDSQTRRVKRRSKAKEVPKRRRIKRRG
jgi:hypothetical protein